MELAFEKVSRKEIYRETGIQFMPINTRYQLFAAKRDSPDLLRAARTLLMIPDLFHYWLTGNAVCEFTNATTTQMVNAGSAPGHVILWKGSSYRWIFRRGFVEPGTQVGALLEEVTSISHASRNAW